MMKTNLISKYSAIILASLFGVMSASAEPYEKGSGRRAKRP